MERYSIEIIRATEEKKRYLPLLLLADPSEKMIDRYLPEGEMFVLYAGGEAVSEAVVLLLRDGICELKNLATLEPQQGKGHASRLVQELFRRYHTAYRTMLVGTSESGVAFYQRLGFSYSHTVPGFFTVHYPEPIWENGKQCVDMIYLKKFL